MDERQQFRGASPFQDLESAATEGEGSKKEARWEKKEQSLRREHPDRIGVNAERRGHREERDGCSKVGTPGLSKSWVEVQNEERGRLAESYFLERERM